MITNAPFVDKRPRAATAVTCSALMLLFAGQAAATPAPSETLDAKAIAEIVAALAETLEAEYIYAERGHEIAAAMRAKAAAGAYDNAVTPVELATALTHDLYDVSSDAHLRVWYAPVADAPSARRRREPDPTYGFRAVEILEGNIGYLDLRGFAGSDAAKPRADTALSFLDGVDALIIDLRRNGGGGPWMVRYLSAYLFGEPTHLVSTWFRGMDAPQERWTADELGVEPRPDMPVYVLTSKRTFSAAESFTFGLLVNGRITTVGERTGGGGHFGGTSDLPHGFTMFVPVGRTYDPRTDKGWEAEGIAPGVAVDADAALGRAHELALGATLGGGADNPLVAGWSGTLQTDAGTTRLTLRIHTAADGTLAGNLVNHRRQREIRLDSVQLEGDMLHCTYAPADIAITLRLQPDGTALHGTYAQGGAPYPLILERR